MSYQQVVDGQVNPEVPINENNAALGQGFVFSHDVTADSGLVVGINGGDFDANTVADTTITGTNNTTNYIVAHRTTRAVSTSTATTNWNVTTTYGRVGRAVFASGVLTYHDERHSTGGIFDHAAGGGFGTGDVVGPGSAVSGHIAVFDGTSGKLIADGGAMPSLSGTNTGDETGARIATLLHASSAKTTLVDADEVNGTDSAASFGLIRTTWTNVKAFLKTYFDTLYAPIAAPVLIQAACSDEATALTAGTAKVTFRAPYAFTLTAVRASVNTAPTGGTLLTIDINESGTSVLSTKLTFDASEKTTTTAATAAVISDSAIADDAEISIDIDSIGSTIAGAGLKITLIGTKP